MARPHLDTAGAESTLASPPARRLQGPSWLDLRLVLGVVIVLASVLVGAKVVAGADKSTTVWAASRDLAAGSTLQASDLKPVRVRLYETSGAYLATVTSPAGLELHRDISNGEMLTESAVAKESSYAVFALSVPAQRVPASLQRGDAINVYTSGPTSPSGGATAAGNANTVVLVAAAATVAEVTGRGNGALTTGSTNLQITLKVLPCAVTDLLTQTEGKTISIVLLIAPPADRSVTC